MVVRRRLNVTLYLHCPVEPHVRLQLPSIVRYLHIRYCRVTEAEIEIPLSLFVQC